MRLTAFFLSLGFCTLSTLSSTATAVVYPQEDMDRLEQQAKDFANQDGYQKHTLSDGLFDRIYNLKHRFPKEENPVYWPDKDLNPIERSILLFENDEKPLPRVRYKISYQPYYDGYQGMRANIEVTRFNLGPTIHQSVSQGVDPEHVAPAEEFGVGPHVSWRIVMNTIQGMLSEPVLITRKELSNEEAAQAECFNQPCLSEGTVTGPDTGWKEIDTPSYDQISQQAKDIPDQRINLVSGLMLKYAHGGEDGYGEASEGVPEGEFPLILVASKDVEGQDTTLNAVMHQQYVMDDEISQIWTQRRQAGETLQWRQQLVLHKQRAQAYEQRKENTAATSPQAQQNVSSTDSTEPTETKQKTDHTSAQDTTKTTEATSQPQETTDPSKQPSDNQKNTISLSAPATVKARGIIEIEWQGPEQWENVIDIVVEGAPASTRSQYQARTTQGSPIILQVPSKPGAYEIRYKKGLTQEVLSRQSLTVE